MHQLSPGTASSTSSPMVNRIRPDIRYPVCSCGWVWRGVFLYGYHPLPVCNRLYCIYKTWFFPAKPTSRSVYGLLRKNACGDWLFAGRCQAGQIIGQPDLQACPRCSQVISGSDQPPFPGPGPGFPAEFHRPEPYPAVHRHCRQPETRSPLQCFRHESAM